MTNLLTPQQIEQIIELEKIALKTHKVEADDPAIAQRRAVFYTDGGWRGPSHVRADPPAVGGYGLFGYLYWPVEAKRNFAAPATIASNCGLLTNEQFSKPFSESKIQPVKVAVTAYIESMGASFHCHSNNTAEVEGVFAALKVIKDLDIQDSLIVSDSQYALFGLWRKCQEWEARNWTREGKPIPNVELWQRIYPLFKELLATGKTIRGEWVKGHQDSKCNVEADRLAGQSMNACVNGIVETHVAVTDPAEVWNPKIDVHPLITEAKIYFDGIDATNEMGGYHFYYLGDPKKLDDDMYGKPSSDNMMAVVALKEPDPVLRTLGDAVTKFRHYNQYSVFVGRLDLALRPLNYTQIVNYGVNFFRRNPHHLEIQLPCKTPLVRQMTSANHGNTGMMEMRYLRDLLAAYMENSLPTQPGVIVNDVTDQFYREVETKKKVTREPRFELADKSVTVEISADLHGVGRIKDRLELSEAVDLPRFRHFKHFLSLSNLKVLVVTVQDGLCAYRHAVIISSDEGVGIWCGVYTKAKIILL